MKTKMRTRTKTELREKRETTAGALTIGAHNHISSQPNCEYGIKGLLKVGEDGVTVLASHVNGTKIRGSSSNVTFLGDLIFFDNKPTQRSTAICATNLLKRTTNVNIPSSIQYDPLLEASQEATYVRIMVLTDTDHCCCVLLNADGGAAFPSETTSQDCSSSNNSSLKINTGSGKAEKTKMGKLLHDAEF